MRSVALSEWLRPWHGVGVTVFLSEFPLDISQLSPEFSPSQASRSRQPSPSGSTQGVGVHGAGEAVRASLGSRGDIPPARASHVATIDSSGTYPNGAKLDRAAGSKDDVAPSFVPSTRAFRSSSDVSEPVKVALFPEPLPREDWPKAFQDYFQKISPSPVLWCYEALGDDLLGTPDQERSQCLKQLIGELRFPKGTSVFWPPALPDVADVAQSQGVLLHVFQEHGQKFRV